MSYPRPGARIDPIGHVLIPYAPRAGLAIGLLALCMLISSGVCGAISPILRPHVARPSSEPPLAGLCTPFVPAVVSCLALEWRTLDADRGGAGHRCPGGHP